MMLTCLRSAVEINHKNSSYRAYKKTTCLCLQRFKGFFMERIFRKKKLRKFLFLFLLDHFASSIYGRSYSFYLKIDLCPDLAWNVAWLQGLCSFLTPPIIEWVGFGWHDARTKTKLHNYCTITN